MLLSSICLAVNITSCNFQEDVTKSSTSIISSTSSGIQSNQEINSTDDCIITIAATERTIGTYKEKVDEFNSEDNGYKIEFKFYDEFYDSSKDTEGGSNLESFAEIDNQMALDVIKGEDIDIITDLSFIDQGKFNELVKKGAFIDLYPFLDSDNEINRGTMLENILKLSEINGELLTIPLFFSVDTLYGETQYVGKKENWTLDEMMERWEQMPEDAVFNGNKTRDSVYREVLAPKLTSFVDIEKGISNFDSSVFLKTLEFINSFPNPEVYKTEPDYSVPNFISKVDIKSFEKYHDLFFDNYNQPVECTFVGYPSEDGCGAYIIPNGRFGISANSAPEKQKGAWLFIKKLLEYDYQYEWGKYCFPVNYSAFSKLGENEYSQSGEEYTYTAQGQERTGTYLNYDEYCRLLDYINNIKRMDTDIDNSITQIINDEIISMIWDEKSPQETAATIQNRVEILVSEKY